MKGNTKLEFGVVWGLGWSRVTGNVAIW